MATPACRTAIRKAVRYLAPTGPQLFAVRSSGAEEDSLSHSFAGQYDSVIGVRGQAALETAIIRCLRSADSARVAAYRSRHCLPASGALAVIVQRLVVPDTAGVLFTRDPVSHSRSRLIIESSFGFPDLVVQGAITPDYFVIERKSRALVARQIGSKERVSRLSKKQGLTVELTPTRLREQYSLGIRSILRLVRVALRLEKQWGMPLDIEWAQRRGRLYLLQARPISTKIGARS
ncbi:MAG: PEP/pyruvate-binding domain-containing protein [Verrucomicrobia bacterium]|nr:PEP/pyruvate-binding domain-containing protein [Verrucomicrobiota bacterium]